MVVFFFCLFFVWPRLGSSAEVLSTLKMTFWASLRGLAVVLKCADKPNVFEFNLDFGGASSCQD